MPAIPGNLQPVGWGGCQDRRPLTGGPQDFNGTAMDHPFGGVLALQTGRSHGTL